MLASQRGNSSAGRAIPCQGIGREFESRFPLHYYYFNEIWLKSNHLNCRLVLVKVRNGECNHAFAVLVSAVSFNYS